jgi:aryl-alcohol dehydrogenase-like predicted oxidoreductase
VEADILRTLRELGISLVAYGVFSRGLLTGHIPSTESTSQGDIRSHFPRFQGENLERNRELIERLREIGERNGLNVAQLAVAWTLAKGTDIIPLIGTKQRDQLAEAIGAMRQALSADEIATIERAVPAGSVAGDRYGPEQMLTLDSERNIRALKSAR